jgi:hypothetical protein
MPRYMVERDFGQVSEEELMAATLRSREVAAARFPDISWDHSHVCADDGGAVVSFCIYTAPSSERIREHADAFGGHSIARILEIADDVTPADLPG